MRRPPKEIEDAHLILSRRSLVFGGSMVGVSSALIWRMIDMQLQDSERYQVLAEKNRVRVELIAPARGLIRDRMGRVIADNEPTYRITMLKADADDPEVVLSRLARLLAMPPHEIAAAREKLAEARMATRVTVAERVPWVAIARVSANGPSLPGVRSEVGLSRVYPLGASFAHAVGYVGPASAVDLERRDTPDPLFSISRFPIGKVGVESRLEDRLRGRAGAREVEVNRFEREIRELSRREGVAGADVQISIDSALQRFIHARMGSESASAVVMDLETGDLKAICSVPSYDPNLFVQGISVPDYAKLRDNERRPLASKTVQDVYPPGSTFKMVTALAALENGIIQPEDTVWCPGHLEVSDRRFHCWKRAGHGSMDLISSLTESCDVYYYQLALDTGIELISDMARKLGLGERFDVEMSSISSGLVPDRKWKEENRGQEWRIGDSVNASIGQGYVLTSPLQLAVMTARLATGRAIMPRLVTRIGNRDIPAAPAPDLGFDPANLAKIKRAMFTVCHDRKGTAYGSRTNPELLHIAGKTGTSQVRNISQAERAAGVIRNEDLPWARRDHALFVNFAPYEQPRIAVSVVVQHGGGGSTAAAPLARDITLFALHGGMPPLDAYPASTRASAAREQARIRALFPDLPAGGDGRA